jgi:hypothetical protein
MNEAIHISSHRANPKARIVILYQPDEEMLIEIVSNMNIPFCANLSNVRIMAGELANLLDLEFMNAQSKWCGMTISDSKLKPVLKYAASDPQGIEKVYLSVPMPLCFADDWVAFYKLVMQEAHYVAMSHRGRAFGYLSLSP